MKWTEKAWNEISPIYNKIIQSAFIKEMINGSLSEDKFIFYLEQDAVYLSDYGRVLAGVASKLSKAEHVGSFVYFAGESMAVEKELHKSFMNDIDIKSIAPSPSCLLYTSYLLRQLAAAPVEVIVAAVLPCFWIYKEVGDYILANQIKGSNPYQSWIDTYGGEEFGSSVAKAIDICDELASKCTEQQQKTMIDAFVACSKMEYLFWDSAYNKEQWKI